MLELGLINSMWVTTIAIIMTGISSAIASMLWVQLFGPSQLAKVSSTVEASAVLTSCVSPIIMGVLIYHYIPLREKTLICLIFILIATMIATRIKADSPEGNGATATVIMTNRIHVKRELIPLTN
ncbi:hypothetical protein [Pantoea agglomerans]|uniref:hypothetical protein n=1 Tax=Enterobacter agglomerans TaxID=549 RepID=UPI00045CEFC5|nr:hypothetical protein [Pantoea agglomerans]KDA92506.1 hypothetical protein T296_22815 [Pantoea agglomerans Eh318]